MGGGDMHLGAYRVFLANDICANRDMGMEGDYLLFHLTLMIAGPKFQV